MPPSPLPLPLPGRDIAGNLQKFGFSADIRDFHEIYTLQTCQPPKGLKKRDSEPTAGKSCEKWVKSREMSQISKQKDLQWGLWVFSGGSRKGAQGALPSLIFRPNWGQKDWKIFFGRLPPPFSKGLDVCPPPPFKVSTSQYGTGIGSHISL